MALAGLDGIRVLQQIRRNDDQIRRQFLFRNHLLSDIRSSLYLSGTYVRDYLLEPQAQRAETNRLSGGREGGGSFTTTWKDATVVSEPPSALPPLFCTVTGDVAVPPFLPDFMVSVPVLLSASMTMVGALTRPVSPSTG